VTPAELAAAVADPRPLVRVLIADDQKVVRDGLVSLLGLLPGIVVVGAAVDGDDAVRKAHDLAADVVPMDLNMPRRNGVEAARLLRESRPATSVVVLTTFSDDAWVFAALRSGARLPDQGRGRRRDSPRHHDGRRRPGAARPIRAATAARRLCPRRSVRCRPPDAARGWRRVEVLGRRRDRARGDSLGGASGWADLP
jgi:CheY-like chemotaxis protein